MVTEYEVKHALSSKEMINQKQQIFKYIREENTKIVNAVPE